MKEEYAEHGFSLIELAIVLFIVSLMGVGITGPLEKALAHKQRARVVAELQLVKESVLAYQVANGVLPCPLSISDRFESKNQAQIAQGQGCLHHTGGVPTRELGIAGSTNKLGALIDPWGRLYQYTVSLNSHSEKGILDAQDWISLGEVSRVGLQEMTADIAICAEVKNDACRTQNLLASELVFLVLSHGPDFSNVGSQQENQDDDLMFAYPLPAFENAERFDDQMVWATAADSLFWLLRAGWLP